ncbi:MAG: SLC13 family permease [Promethearchaeota archaeon]
MTEKLNRAIAALSGAIVTYFVLIFIENFNFSVVVDLLFGSSEDDYVNLHSLILIIAMMIVVIISNEAGLFQFIAVKLIILSHGKPIRLMIIFCLITVILSAVLNNILTVIILIPLTITISRILNIDPTPYILTQAVLVNIGGTMFSISSIPNILITTYAKISFTDFFLNVGLISLVIFGFTLIFFILLYKNELVIPPGGAEILKEFDVWNFVPNKKLLILTIISFIILIVLLVIIPPSILTPDIIAISIAAILIIISRLEPKEIIAKVDFELILYLISIFIIAGALEITGVTDAIAIFMSNLGGGDILTEVLIILWISAFLSSSIDNIPITKVLIPVIDSIPVQENPQNQNLKFYSLAIGANWGDNLTPLGDNILVMNICEQHKRPLSLKQFFKLGFITTVYQLTLVSLIFILIFELILGIIVITSIFLSILTIYLLHKSSKTIGHKIDKLFNKIRISIIR